MSLKSLFDPEVVNTGRQKSIDCIKAFAILYMVTVHWYEEMSCCYADGTTTVLGYIIEFLGGPLSAPVFMFAMGLGIVYSGHRSPAQLLKRGVKLLAFNYILNLFRSAGSYLIVGNIAGYFNMDDFLYLAFNVDILGFCGMAFIFTALLKKLKTPVWAMPIIGIVMMTVGSFIDYQSTSIFGQYILVLFVKSGKLGYFPLLNWYFYPAMGIAYAKYLRHVSDQKRLHTITLTLSLTLLVGIIGGALAYGINPLDFFTVKDDTYYKQNFLSAVFCIGCVLLCEAVFYLIFDKVHIKKLDELIFFMSNYLNTIFIIQWLIIGNTMATLFWSGTIDPFPVWVSVPLGVMTTVVSTFLAKYARKIIKL